MESDLKDEKDYLSRSPNLSSFLDLSNFSLKLPLCNLEDMGYLC